MKTLNKEEIKRMVEKAGPNIDSRYDMTRKPCFVEGRTDLAVVQRDAEDGSTYGRTKWYVAYDKGSGTTIEELLDTGNIHDNCHTNSIEVIDGVLTVKVSYGSRSPVIKKSLSSLGLY